VWDPTFRDPDITPRWVEPLAWDADGALYHLWSEGRELWLGRSTDQGRTWDRWPVAHDDDRVFYPYLVGRGPGELAATWFSGRAESLRVHVARIDVGPGAPQVNESVLFQPDSWTQQRIRNPAGEYVPVAFLTDGGLAVVTPIQDVQGNRWGFSWWRVGKP